MKKIFIFFLILLVIQACSSSANVKNKNHNVVKHDSTVNRVLAEQAALLDASIAASKAANEVSKARPLSRKGLGAMIFGNVYDRGLADTKTRSDYLQASLRNLLEARRMAKNISLRKFTARKYRVSCSNFSTQADAQLYFDIRKRGWKSLDRDKDGEPCECLRGGSQEHNRVCKH